MQTIKQATLAIICCHILTGTASVITRYLVNVLEPVEVAFLRYLLGGLAILPLFFIYRSACLNKNLSIKIIGLGVLFFGLFPFLFSWSFVYTNAARGSLVLATMPIWTIVVNRFIKHERMNHLALFAIGLTFTGLVIALADKLLLGTGQGFVAFKGELIMLMAAIAGGVYTVFARDVLQTVPASTMTPLAMLSGCLCLLPFSVASGVDVHLIALSPSQLMLMIYLGIVTGGIAFFLLNWSLNKSSATFVSLFVTLNPITAIFLGALFLGEAISINFIVGVLVVFLGLALAVKSKV